MASFLTLPQELRDEIIDLILLSTSSCALHTGTVPNATQLPCPRPHPARTIFQICQQIRSEAIQRVESLRMVQSYVLNMRIYGDLYLQSAWTKIPVHTAKVLDTIEIHLNLTPFILELLLSSAAMPGNMRRRVGAIFRQAIHHLTCGCSATDISPCLHSYNEAKSMVQCSRVPVRSIRKLMVYIRCKDDEDEIRKYSRPVINPQEWAKRRCNKIADKTVEGALEQQCLAPLDFGIVSLSDEPDFGNSNHSLFWTRIGTMTISVEEKIFKTWNIEQELLDGATKSPNEAYFNFFKDMIARRREHGLGSEAQDILKQGYQECGDPEAAEALMEKFRTYGKRRCCQ